MALDKLTLADTLWALLNTLSAETDNPANARLEFANGFADAIDTYVKGGELSVPGLGLEAGSTPVTGISTTGTII